MRKVVIVAVVTLLCVCLSVLVIAGVPADKKTIKLDCVPGKKGAVTFQHAKHNEEYKKAGGKSIVCKDCHHTLKVDKPDAAKVKKCSACHVKEGEAQKEHEGKKASFLATKKGDKYNRKSVIFHDQCVKCHKAMKAEGKKIGKCKTCHP